MSIVGAGQPPADVIELATSLPTSVRLGTSSWSFPGWRGLVFAKQAPAAELARFGLAAYAEWPLHRTVGLDRAFYSVLSVGEARSLAELVPSDFRFLVKAHQSITRPFVDVDGSTFGDTDRLARSGAPNPTFLDPSFAAERVILPLVEGFGSKLGPIVFQFPPFALRSSGEPAIDRWWDRLDRFLAALPVGPIYAVEVRNGELLRKPLAGRLFSMLKTHRVALGFAVLPSLPDISRQLAIADECGWPVEEHPALSLRWLLGHGLSYDGAKARYAPFDRLLDPDEVTRSSVVSLIHRALASAQQTWIIANNKAEGSAPMSLVELARRLRGT